MAAHLLYLGFILFATTTIQSHIISNHDVGKYLKIAPFVPLQHLEDEPERRPYLELFYESMCPECRKFYTTYFSELESKLRHHMYFITYPYGKAATTTYYNGTITFLCQHGETECYGNKLHACAVNITINSCLMEFDRSDNGSNDAAVDECGSKLNITYTDFIKKCAKGDLGTGILKSIGEESVRVNYRSLPHIRINGKHWTGKYEELIKDVCATFKNPPEACKDAK